MACIIVPALSCWINRNSVAPPAVGSSDHIKLVTVYGLALHQGFGYSGGSFHDAASSHIAVAITFEVVDGKYVLKEYWTPRDGSYYVQDIRDKFLTKLRTKPWILRSISSPRSRSATIRPSVTAELIPILRWNIFLVIESSPPHLPDLPTTLTHTRLSIGSLPTTEAIHCSMYSHSFRGGQTGLRGHLMRSVLDDLAPEAQLRLYAETGQEYFDVNGKRVPFGSANSTIWNGLKKTSLQSGFCSK